VGEEARSETFGFPDVIRNVVAIENIDARISEYV
jgi:hypothetical protein